MLARNPKIDAVSLELVRYLQDCIKTKRVDINFGYVPAMNR